MKHFKYIKDYNEYLLESSNDYTVGDVVLIRYAVIPGEAILTPVRIINKFAANSYMVTHKTEDSSLKNFPDFSIKGSDIISRYHMIDDIQTGISITTNPQINPQISGALGQGQGKQNLPANQSPSNDISV